MADLIDRGRAALGKYHATEGHFAGGDSFPVTTRTLNYQVDVVGPSEAELVELLTAFIDAAPRAATDFAALLHEAASVDVGSYEAAQGAMRVLSWLGERVAAPRAATEPLNDEAGHRVEEAHSCFAMNCKDLGPEVLRLRNQVVAATLPREPLADLAGADAILAALATLTKELER